ncbi:MAG: HD domain-containing protein [Acidimicrobiales bacterium]|jgi:dGTPase|nr:HD domain-containing protein [Acidimicrobiales bacterium]|tara:strand:- start:135 stop:1292 length:1158 start_codon:yes stop_codon:yes gene_type:complete
MAMQEVNPAARGASERSELWASTMDGTTTAGTPEGVRTAHSDSTACAASSGLLDRESREGDDEAQLSADATRVVGAGNRLVEEPSDHLRTCFERDRDRILHSTSFRRLAGKTQVFVFPEDHQRSRLTHALEVAQVATSIARALRLNVALAEAIALGHDCGHGPGGHASEDALSPYLEGGYDHAVWGADVALAPLNLCSETLDGIRNHSWSRPAPSTPEGEVVSWADRIAYVCHDFEDAEHAGVVGAADLPLLVRERCGTTRREQLAALINGLLSATSRTGRVSMDEPMAEALAAFRAFNYEDIYLRPASVEQAGRVIDMLRALVDHITSNPRCLPGDADMSGTDATRIAAVGYVGGMTDRFACRSAMRLLDWPLERLPAGLDLRP